MFTSTGSGIRNILTDARLYNPAQLTFCPAQFASKKAHNFHFVSRTLSEGLHKLELVTYESGRKESFKVLLIPW